MKLEAINYGRRQVKRLWYVAALSVLALTIFAPNALAQSGNLDPSVTQPCPIDLDQFPEGTVCGEGGGYVVPEGQPQPGDSNPPINQPCPGQLDQFPEGTVCGEGGGYVVPGDGRTVTCEDFEDQGQAQEALGRGLRGDPAYPPDVLDEDGDGVACEELPTVTDPLAPDLGDEVGEDGEITCEDFEDQGQAQEALGRVLRGDPAADAEDLDPDGNGIACEELPTVTDPLDDNLEQPEVAPPDDDEGETTRRERRERTDRERTGREGTDGEVTGPNGEITGPSGEVTGPNGEITGPNGEVTGPNGEVTGPDGEVTGGANGGGGGGGSGGGSAGGDGNSQGGGGGGTASQGGVSGAVADAVSPVTRGRLPNTGGGWAVLLAAGAALIGGGAFLLRRFSSSA